MRYDAIIFDLDGTLWQTKNSYLYAYHQIIDEYQISSPLKDEQILDMMGYKMDAVAEKAFGFLPDNLKLELIAKCLRYSCEYLLDNRSTVFEGVLPTIKQLSQTIKLFIVSNCPQEYIDVFFIKSNLKKYFIDYRYLTNETNKIDNISSLIHQHNLQNPLFVGDSDDDFQSANHFKLDFAYCRYGYRVCKNYHYLVKSIVDIIDIIKKQNVFDKITKDADYRKQFLSNGAQVALLKNPSQNEKDYVFGFWHFAENEQANIELFDEMEEDAKKNGASTIIGPINYTTWFSYRLALDNFDWKLYPDIDNSLIQVKFLEKRGYQLAYKYVSTLALLDQKLWQKAQTIQLDNDYTIVVAKNQEAYQYIKDIYEISIDSFQNGFLYSEISYDDFYNLYLENISSASPDIVIIYHLGQPVAFSFCYEDPAKRFYVSKTVGIKKEYQSSKIIMKIVDESFRMMADRGYTEVLYHFQNVQKNVLTRVWRHTQLKVKYYGLFRKELL